MKEIMDFGLVRQLARENGLDQVLDEPALAELRLLEAAKGEMICAKGERPERLYFLVQGKLKIYTTLPNGKVSCCFVSVHHLRLWEIWNW